MKIEPTLPSPLPLKIQDEYGVPSNLTGIPAESFYLNIIDRENNKGQEGTGKFIILDPMNGLLKYEWSEEELQNLPGMGRFEIEIGQKDGVAGPAKKYSIVLSHF